MSDDHIKRIRDALALRVGGFFRNTRRVPGETCTVCCGPATRRLCTKCEEHEVTHGEGLADLVLTLTYAQDKHPSGRHQSVHTAYSYKNPVPVPKAVQDMRFLVAAATLIHGACFAAVGGAWDAITFVPSTSRADPPRDHPTAGLARMVAGHRPEQRLLLEPGSDYTTERDRIVRRHLWAVRTQDRERVSDRHVLVVDDTWTSGAKMQSAALALKDAGAARVTGLAAVRWCRWDWADHAALLETLTSPYDALACPVGTEACRATS